MKTAIQMASATALALVLAAPAFAVDDLIGVGELNDRIDDITEAAEDDIANAEDAERHSALGVAQGWRGSLALTASATSGNTDNGELSLAGRLTYGVGDWNHLFGFAGEFARTGSVSTEEKIYGVYEANRYFSETLYGFGTGRYQYDAFATNQHDAFLGVGLGYRIINDDNMTWRVQAGPGVRYVKDNTGVDTTEFSGIASSRFYYAFSDTVSLTNDTDVLGSNSNIIATNDLGLNFKVTDNVSTRASYRTEYNSDPLPGFEKFDNTIGMSLVVGF